MNREEFCLQILESPFLEDKTSLPPEELRWGEKPLDVQIPNLPNREKKISFSEKKTKIPKFDTLGEPQNVAITLHHFANHELMAVELFAWAILNFPNATLREKNGWWHSLTEEIQHFHMYANRIRQLGLEFGERPINSLFWNHLKYMSTKEKFQAVMCLGFEGANLDYSFLYRNVFRYYSDLETSSIMEKVYFDEIIHVRRGVTSFPKELRTSGEFWSYYLGLLDKPLTPRRAKGMYFSREARTKALFPTAFIDQLEVYEDEWSTKRAYQDLSKFLSK